MLEYQSISEQYQRYYTYMWTQTRLFANTGHLSQRLHTLLGSSKKKLQDLDRDRSESLRQMNDEVRISEVCPSKPPHLIKQLVSAFFYFYLC